MSSVAGSSDAARESPSVGIERLAKWQLLAIVLLALVVRVGFEVSLRSDDGAAGALAAHLLGDERAYDAFARASADGSLDRERAFYQEPAYAWLLGRVYSLWPPTDVPNEAAVIARDAVRDGVILLQHLLGILLAVTTARLGARALGRRAGFVAGVFMALSGPTVFHEAMLLKASLSLLLVVLCLGLWLDVLERPTRGRSLVLGLCMGLGIMLRGNLYLLLALVLASLVLRRSARTLQSAVLVGATALVVISPLTIHNIQRGDWVLTTYQAGTNAAMGQPPGIDPELGLMYEPLRAGRGDARFEEADAVALAEEAVGARLGGREVSSWWWAQVASQVQAEPVVALQRMGWKLLHLVHGLEVPDVKDWAFFAQRVPWLNTPLSNFWVLGPWALLGLMFLPWRHRPGLLVVRGGVLVVAVSLVLFYVMGRYRLTAVPMLNILAAGALCAGWDTLRSPAASWRKGLVLLAGVGLPLAMAQIPMPTASQGFPVSWSNASTIEKDAAVRATDPVEASSRRERALAWARRATELAPLFPSARMAELWACEAAGPALAPLPDEARAAAWRLALLMEGLRTGRDVSAALRGPEAAVAQATVSLLDLPSRTGKDAFTAAGRASAARALSPRLKPQSVPYLPPENVLGLALRFADLAVRLEPDEAVALVQRGLAWKRLGRLSEAEADYRAAAVAGIDSVSLHNNLGNLLLETGRAAEAEASFLRALEHSPDDPVVLRNLQRARAANGKT